ncbi:MAG: pirin family protein [Actinomycetota bacterium]
MMELRDFDRLGRFDNDWLHARYHFSFADYHDPGRMGLGFLRVWNDDAIEPHTGFAPHSHRDMEIVTYIRQGAITHEDSLGNIGRTEAGQVQVMSAGSGITHAEFNRDDDLCRLFQIWIVPRARGLTPRWETRPFPREHGVLQVLASGLPGDEHVPVINQDARVLGATLDPGDTFAHPLNGRLAYLVPARGAVAVGGTVVGERSGLVVDGEAELVVEALEASELVVVETS